MPERIQRRRSKGWRMPEGAVYVGRPTRWGNPYRNGMTMSIGVTWDTGVRDETEIPMTLDNAVAAYRSLILARVAMTDYDDAADRRYAERWRGWLSTLYGLDLACWCPLDQPCHADVLLELANGDHHG